MVYKYEWKFKIFPVDPNDVGKEFEKIEKENGKVTAKKVVEVAKDEKNIMHSCFEWNDTKAAEKYRFIEAHNLISQLVKVSIKEPQRKEVRAYVNINQKNGFGQSGEFISIERAMSKEETRNIVLNKALDELIAFKNKYRNLREFEELFLEIEKLCKKIT